MIDDPIVAEVRKARKEIERQCGNTLEGLAAHLKQLEKEPGNASRMISRPSRKLSR